jgi:hypothetical protein
MPDDLDLDAAMAAAEHAAGSGDFAAAERHLSDAARLQEEALGPAHPDLANTLNNLGVVYERNGRTDEAEASYRRAYTIARETLAPDHPFVATSAENLREFCETNGRPFDVPDEGAAVEAPPIPMAVVDVEPMGAASPETPVPLSPEPAADDPPAPAANDSRSNVQAKPAPAAAAEARVSRPVRVVAPASPTVEARARSARWRMLLLFVSIAAAVVLWMFGRSHSGTPMPAEGGTTAGESSAPAPGTPASPTPAESAPTTPPEPPSSAPSSLASVPPVAAPDASSSSSSASSPAAAAPPPASAASSTSSAPPVPTPFPTATRADAPPTSITVARADVCGSFSTRASSGADWRCDALGATAPAGVLVFYTRIRTPRATTVEHRWYRGDTLVQSVRLRIGANPGAGYRTSPRNTVGAGAWRVELHAGDGTLLHEARFTVR